MNAKNKNTGMVALMGISPWLIIGAMFILVPIFIFMTFDNVRKQREHTIQVFTEKGDTLIRAFEAGVRSGMMEQQVDFFRLQKLLMETAQQPDIDFITVTDIKGKIIADSDPSLIGENYGSELDLDRLSQSAKIAWRLAPNPDGVDTFEVFRRFAPSGSQYDSRPEGKVQAGKDGPIPRLVIFIGLNVGPIEASRKNATRHTILMAALLLFIGLSGVVSLFLAQGYRSARLSLSRIRVFTDSLVEHMPIGLVALDNGGMIISFNQTAESILRLPARKVIGGQGPKILPLPFQEIIRALAGEKGIIEKELDCPLADGKTIPLEVIATTLTEENGAFLGSVILFRDLTELRHLKEEIARSQRLASLGNLAAGVAHEIRNPLSSIKGFATYFKERYRDNPLDGETADIMVQEVERLNRVITQLLDFARPLTVEKKPTPLVPLIRQTLKMVAGQAEAKHIAIQADLTDIPEVMIDADKIKQVLFNLFLNALEMMPERGILQVKVAPVEGNAVKITISDSGPGIDGKHLAHIFDPYFTTRPSGTGLGLSIVHKIIEAHGGEIRAESIPGAGATFSILLPAREKEAFMKTDNIILVVDDDLAHRTMLRTLLSGWGYKVVDVDDGEAAIREAREKPFDLILMDIRMIKVSGLEALAAIKAYNPAIPILIMTAYASVETAVEALKNGAYDYLTKPLDFTELRLTMERAMDHSQLKEENKKLHETLSDRFDRVNLIGRSRPMTRLLETVALVAPAEATILITGESGTGKEMIAGAIHFNSPRRDGPFIKINCAALTETLLESELFGHEKGAFTGADRRKEGKFRQADGGTLLLDEVSEMSLAMQVKLLRVLQEREITRVGGEEVIKIDVRLIAATNRDLIRSVEEGRFREDLYYRLNVVNLEVPSLRERKEDIPLIAQHYLKLFAEKNHKIIKGFTPQAMDRLLKYTWPGNVRELINAVERCVVLSRSEYLTEEELLFLRDKAAPEGPQIQTETVAAPTSSLEEVERDAILRILKITGGNKSEAARQLGITRRTLHKKLKSYGLM